MNEDWLCASRPTSLALTRFTLSTVPPHQLPPLPPFIVAWAGGASTGPALELPAALGTALGLAPGTFVSVTPLPALPPALSVTVEPAGPDDWELVECHAGDVEADLLTQVGVVAVGQPFPYWVRPGVSEHGGASTTSNGGPGGLVGGRPILLTVTSASPGPAVRLVRGTEVAVAPRPRARAGEAVVLRGSVAAEGATAPPFASPGAAPPPPLWLRVQDADAPSASYPLDLPPWQTTLSTTVWVCPAAAAAAGLEAGAIVCLSTRTGPPAARAFAALAVGGLPSGATAVSVSPGHIILPAPLARSIGAAPLGRVALVRTTAAASSGDLPALVVLRPGKEGGGGQGGPASRLAGLPPAALASLFASWLRAQAVGGTGGGSTNGGALPPVVLAEGALLRLAFPPGYLEEVVEQGTHGGAPSSSLDAAIELHWPGGAARRPRRPILLDPASAGAGGVRVEVGSPADLPPALVGPATSTPSPPAPSAGPWTTAAGSISSIAPAPWISRHVPAALAALLPALDARARAALAMCAPDHSLPPSARRAGLLITGPSGCGKTALAAALASSLAAHPACRAGVVRVACREWDVVDAPAAARAGLETALRAAAAQAPSLLILDDLDVLGGGSSLGSPSLGEAADPAGAGGAALGVWLAEALGGRLGGHAPASAASSLYPPALPLAVVATATDGAAVPAELKALFLSHTVALPALSASGRAAVLRTALAARGAAVSPADARQAASAAEGCDAADLTALADRAVHAAAGRCAASGGGGPGGGSGHGPPLVTAADLEAASAGFEPSSAWAAAAPSGASASASSPSGWEDVGGLEAAQAALLAALDPFHSKRRRARRRAPPLRPRTGVLLYGPPGCGKTHALAAAIAAAGARVVAVKGPELLNKYIGASESAVRAVFARAAAAAPCVLLFDEFDALAPRRGADSTGVTDRVVNQLLTELDGATGLTGVVVLAASSRPDLLDPALLRPGRLDRSVYCGPPASPGARLAILRALARRAALAPDAVAALPAIADTTPGFTGADLGAVLAEAQLAAVHGALQAMERKRDGDQHAAAAAPPLITAAHLRAAAASARPSLPAGELARLEGVYARFAGRAVGGGGGGGSAAAVHALPRPGAEVEAAAAARAAAKGKAPLVLRGDEGGGGTGGNGSTGGLLTALELGGGMVAGTRVTMK